jgi:hypothetical protein
MMFLDQSLLINSLDAIRARSGTEFSAGQVERFTARVEDLDFALAHARRIMKRHQTESKPESPKRFLSKWT